MARVFIDGFEAGDLKLWDAVVGTITLSTGILGMDGYALRNTSYDSFACIGKNLDAKDEYFVAFRYNPIDISNSQQLIVFYNSSTKIGSIRRNRNTLCLSAYDNTDTLLVSGTTPILANNTCLIEVRFKPNTSDGIIQIKINSIMDIDFTGNTGSALNINKFYIGNPDIAEAYTYAYFDNVIVDNATWPGNTKIQAIVPTGAGNSTQWTPSEGANYQCVDEKPASEVDFISTNTIDVLDQFTAGDLAGSIESIKCVQVQALAKAEGAPTPTGLQLSVRTGDTDYLGDTQLVPNTTSKQLCQIWEDNPNTSAPWEVSEVNAMEIGVKAVA